VLILIPLLLSYPLLADVPSPEKLDSLYNSLDPTSLAEHFALYKLYPNAPQGEKAKQEALKLLGAHHLKDPILPEKITEALVAIINQNSHETLKFTEKELLAINELGAKLKNRSLQGYKIASKKELLALAPSQIDIARAALLSQLGTSEQALETIRQYEASLDLMALQVLARLPSIPPPKTIVQEMNRLIFEEMRFRFPPESLHAKNIDLYTFLPSVFDQRRGVCLGVSILYLSLSQRIGLPLEAITPPGHIYIRYRNGDKIINIETTARGVNYPSHIYLGVNTRSLAIRTYREVIGFCTFQPSKCLSAKKRICTSKNCL